MAGGSRLEGKVAIVTGAASGFGLAISIRFFQEGCRVYMTDVNKDALDAIASKKVAALTNGKPFATAKLDVSSAADWKKTVDECIELYGQLDIVVNNAGTSYRNKPTLDVTEEEFDRVIAVNLKSIYHSVVATVPELQRQSGGSIINIGSIGSVRPRPGLVWYNASKAAVTNATKGLAAEYGPSNIRVNSIAPLLCGTGLFETFVGVPDTPENREKFVANVPLGRLTEVEDVANAALYLASDEGKFITGVNLEVDGGRAI